MRLALKLIQLTSPTLRPDDIVIGVMGVTGVGKSTFINYFAHDDVEIGNDLESCNAYHLLA